MRDIRELFRAAGGFGRFLILIILRCPFDAVNTIVISTFLRLAFNAVNAQSVPNLYSAIAFYGIGSLLLFMYNGSVWAAYATWVSKWITGIRAKLFERISALSVRQIEERASGDFITRLNADAQAAIALMGHPLQIPHAVCATVNITISSILLISVNPAVYGLILLFVVPHMLISQLVVARPMTRLAMQAQQATAKTSTDLTSLIVCADAAMLYDAQDFLLSRFERHSLELRDANMRMRYRSAFGAGLLPIMGMAGYLVLLLISAEWIANGTITFGDLTAVFQLRGGVLVGAMMLTNSIVNIKASLAGVRRVNETLSLSTEG